MGTAISPRFLYRERGGASWGFKSWFPKLQEPTLGVRELVTHWQNEIMLDFLQMAQGQDEALWVPLALPDQEHTWGRQSSIIRDSWLQLLKGLAGPQVCYPAQPSPVQPLTHPPGPAVQLAAGSPPERCVHETRAGCDEWLGSEGKKC